MSNEISQGGVGNYAFQDIKDSTIIILGKSAEYQDLVERLSDKKRLLSYIPENEIQGRISISKEINNLESLINHTRQEVIRLADTFNKIEINTDRLIKAKEFFDKGEFASSRFVLESDVNQMIDEQNNLLEKRDYYEQEILPKLRHSSEEFLVLAISMMFDYDNPNQFENASDYFERSLKSFQTKENTFIYAKFLQDYSQFPKSEKYYIQYLEKFDNELTSGEKSSGLNNLAILYDYKHDYDKAIEIHKEALEIRRKLAQAEPEKYLADVATTTHNLATIYYNQTKFDEALKLFEEALEVRKELAKEDKKILPYVGTSLHNLAGVYKHKGNDYRALELYLCALSIFQVLSTSVSNEYLHNYSGTLNNMGIIYESWGHYKDALKTYKDSLQIMRNLAETNPRTFQDPLAITLNNIGNAYRFDGDFDNAEKSYYEALEIYRNLESGDSKSYTPNMASTLGNLAEFFFSGKPNREKSINYAVESVRLLLPIVRRVPFTRTYLENAYTVLRNWNYIDLEIEKQIFLLDKEGFFE